MSIDIDDDSSCEGRESYTKRMSAFAKQIKHPEDGLSFFMQKEHKYSLENLVQVNFMSFLKMIATDDINYRLFMFSAYKGHHIPIIDCDTQDKMVITSMWLDENKIDYSIVSSSPGRERFWVFPDKTCSTAANAIEYMKAIPGNDNNYMSCTEKYGEICVRGEMKNDYDVPKIIKDGSDRIVNEFVGEIIKHFSSEAIKWLHRYRLYKNGKIDLSNPNIDTPKFSLSDILG